MKVQLVYVEDLTTLMNIKQTLETRSHFVQNPWFEAYFDRLISLKNTKQPLFSIGINENQPTHIRIVYSLHTEYKLTRQLCKCVHIQQLYTCPHVSKDQVQQFQKDLIPQLNCYKVVAINISQNSVLKANQQFMTIQNKASL